MNRAAGAWIKRGVIIGGLLTVAAAIGWWWLVFSPVIEGALLPLPQAGACMAVGSDVCTLAQSLCRGVHLFDIKHYSSDLFWIGIGLLGFSLVLGGGSSPPARETAP